MSWLSGLVHIWKAVFRRRQVERDLDDELQAFLDELTERKVEAGVPLEEARREALLEAGAIDLIKDDIRRQHRAPVGSALALSIVALVFFALGAGTTARIARWGDGGRVDRAPGRSVDSGQAGEAVRPRQVFVSADSPIGHQPRPSFQGVVRDRDTGLPLGNVQISLRSEPAIVTTRTDGQGRFRLAELPPESYGLVLGRTGWTVPIVQRLSGQMFAGVPGPYPYLELDPPGDAPYRIALTDEDGSPLEATRLVTFSGGREEATLALFDPRTTRVELAIENVPALRKRQYFR